MQQKKQQISKPVTRSKLVSKLGQEDTIYQLISNLESIIQKKNSIREIILSHQKQNSQPDLQQYLGNIYIPSRQIYPSLDHENEFNEQIVIQQKREQNNFSTCARPSNDKVQTNVSDWDLSDYIWKQSQITKSHDISVELLDSATIIKTQIKDIKIEKVINTQPQTNEFLNYHNPDFLHSFGMSQNKEQIKKLNKTHQRFPRDVFLGNVERVKRVMSQKKPPQKPFYES